MCVGVSVCVSTGSKCWLLNQWKDEVSCRAIIKITQSGSQQRGMRHLITSKSSFTIVLYPMLQVKCSIYTCAHTHTHSHRISSRASQHLISNKKTIGCAIMIIIFSCHCSVEHWDARLHPIIVTWLITMPTGGLLQVELISRVMGFRIRSSTELITLFKGRRAARRAQMDKCVDNAGLLRQK